MGNLTNIQIANIISFSGMGLAIIGFILAVWATWRTFTEDKRKVSWVL